ncbi:LacI family DNA-binding transcriptional regulator [Brachybacterium sp. EE-P12]|uniref:LacI family DNA-binding transcriptional regulator n=1 Tax=Brachybacterium sp. EE-P12 TaxID=2306299 RepID=UPI000F098626|nr:LacI family DNA-binding transcriptional regulator [Brachybacterium sp. EE-P12]
MRVTLRDVAEQAGVSVATVSRALSRPEMVSEDARDRIQEISLQLGYRPSRAPRELAPGSSGALGVIVPDLLNPFYPALLKGAQARAREHGMHLLLADAEETPDGELPLVQTLAPQVDGILLCSSRMSESDLEEAAGLTRLCLVNRRHRDLSAVSFDALSGVRSAVRHLAALGHRRIGCVSGPRTSRSEAERRDALAQVGAELDVEIVDIGHFPPSIQGGSSAAEPLLLHELSAALAYNDVMAIGLISGLHALGFSVPADISVVGWDDIEYAAVSSPALSTVRVPRLRIGALGIDALVAPAGAVTEQRLETRFVPRDSTARRRGAGGGLLAVSDRAEEQAAPTQEQAAPTEAVAGPQAPDHGRAARVW